MSNKNRTKEFERILKTLNNKKINSASVVTNEYTKNKENSCIDEFQLKTEKIKISIDQLAEKIKDLSNLANKSNIFKENTEEIARFSISVKRNIDEISKTLYAVENLHVVTRTKNQQTHNHHQIIVQNLKTNLAGLTKEFQDILALRADKLRTYRKRKDLYSIKSDIIQRDFSALKPKPSPLPYEYRDDHENSNNRRVMTNTPIQQQIHRGVQRTPLPNSLSSSSEMNSRIEATQNIEKLITELSSMYQRLATIVSVQDEVCTRIDSNVSSASVQVNDGHSQLQKYNISVSGNRLLILKIFSMLIFIAVLFFMFVN